MIINAAWVSILPEYSEALRSLCYTQIDLHPRHGMSVESYSCVTFKISQVSELQE
jgi:hypothetical protein